VLVSSYVDAPTLVCGANPNIYVARCTNYYLQALILPACLILMAAVCKWCMPL